MFADLKRVLKFTASRVRSALIKIVNAAEIARILILVATFSVAMTLAGRLVFQDVQIMKAVPVNLLAAAGERVLHFLKNHETISHLLIVLAALLHACLLFREGKRTPEDRPVIRPLMAVWVMIAVVTVGGVLLSHPEQFA